MGFEMAWQSAHKRSPPFFQWATIPYGCFQVDTRARPKVTRDPKLCPDEKTIELSIFVSIVQRELRSQLTDLSRIQPPSTNWLLLGCGSVEYTVSCPFLPASTRSIDVSFGSIYSFQVSFEGEKKKQTNRLKPSHTRWTILVATCSYVVGGDHPRTQPGSTSPTRQRLAQGPKLTNFSKKEKETKSEEE